MLQQDGRFCIKNILKVFSMCLVQNNFEGWEKKMWFDISVNQNLWPEEPPSALSGLKGGVSCWDRVSGSAYRNKVREALHRKKSMSVILIDNKLAISCTDVMIQ